jgi:hypothetical protein
MAFSVLKIKLEQLYECVTGPNGFYAKEDVPYVAFQITTRTSIAVDKSVSFLLDNIISYQKLHHPNSKKLIWRVEPEFEQWGGDLATGGAGYQIYVRLAFD